MRPESYYNHDGCWNCKFLKIYLGDEDCFEKCEFGEESINANELILKFVRDLQKPNSEYNVNAYGYCKEWKSIV